MITRRDILQGMLASGVLTLPVLRGQAVGATALSNNKKLKEVLIKSVSTSFEREPLAHPFGFKGGFLTQLWQAISCLESDSGHKKIGLGTQSVLWSEPDIFTSHSENGGNALMYAVTEYAAQLVKGMKYSDPIELQQKILPQVYEYGKKITNQPDLRETFILNALVGLDIAAWLLYAAENEISDFDSMIPTAYRAGLTQRHKQLAGIPLISYGLDEAGIQKTAKEGYFFLKIKLGQQGTQEEMLQKDMEYMTHIHNALKDLRTPHTKDGKLIYYYDANGRYEKKETLLRYIDHLKKIGAFDQVAIIEEPFPEEAPIDVSDIPVRIAADECAHTDKDVVERIQMGYTGIALKPIAKTLSMTMRMIKAAKEKGIPCFCADLTVNPILVEWNKNIAARLDPLPGMEMGVLESNGPQNYKNWEKMNGYYPASSESWIKSKEGLFELNDEYYAQSGGVFEDSPHYTEMFQ